MSEQPIDVDPDEQAAIDARLRALLMGQNPDAVKLDMSGVDLAAVEREQNDDSRLVPGWEAPRILPAHWREVQRDPVDGGAKYLNARARIQVILSCSIERDGRAWLHFSCSHPERPPNWQEIKDAKAQFLGDRESYMVFPPKARWINIHPHVLHLFALLDGADALPDFTRGTGSL